MCRGAARLLPWLAHLLRRRTPSVQLSCVQEYQAPARYSRNNNQMVHSIVHVFLHRPEQLVQCILPAPNVTHS